MEFVFKNKKLEVLSGSHMDNVLSGCIKETGLDLDKTSVWDIFSITIASIVSLADVSNFAEDEGSSHYADWNQFGCWYNPFLDGNKSFLYLYEGIMNKNDFA